MLSSCACFFAGCLAVPVCARAEGVAKAPGQFFGRAVCGPIGGSSVRPPVVCAHRALRDHCGRVGRAPAVACRRGGTAGPPCVCWRCSGSRFPVGVAGGGSGTARRIALAATRRSFATRRRHLHRRGRGEGGWGGDCSWLVYSHGSPAWRRLSRRISSVHSGTMGPSATPQPRFGARPPQGASCQVRLVQGWMGVFSIPW